MNSEYESGKQINMPFDKAIASLVAEAWQELERSMRVL